MFLSGAADKLKKEQAARAADLAKRQATERRAQMAAVGAWRTSILLATS